MFKPLKPKEHPMYVIGRLGYDDKTRGHALLRFKKEVLIHFPTLKESKGVFYQQEYHWNLHETLQRIKEVYDKKGVLPMLLYLQGDANE